MPKFQVRYKVGHEPSDADENCIVVVEAATFQTQGKFIDFYADAVENTIGTMNPKGPVVYRLAEDVVADIRQAK